MNDVDRELLARAFWKRVGDTEDCWIWVGAINNKGYGVLSHSNQKKGSRLAHRFAWILYRGEIPAGLWVLHVVSIQGTCSSEQRRTTHRTC
jgi:hypothetical protein